MKGKRRWRLRKRLLPLLVERDGASCCWCGRPFATWDEATIEHVWPQFLGGSSEPENLRLACGDCNVANDPTRQRLGLLDEGFLQDAAGKLFSRCDCQDQRNCWAAPKCQAQRWNVAIGRELARRRLAGAA